MCIHLYTFNYEIRFIILLFKFVNKMFINIYIYIHHIYIYIYIYIYIHIYIYCAPFVVRVAVT